MFSCSSRTLPKLGLVAFYLHLKFLLYKNLQSGLDFIIFFTIILWVLKKYNISNLYAAKKSLSQRLPVKIFCLKKKKVFVSFLSSKFSLILSCTEFLWFFSFIFYLELKIELNLKVFSFSFFKHSKFSPIIEMFFFSLTRGGKFFLSFFFVYLT